MVMHVRNRSDDWPVRNGRIDIVMVYLVSDEFPFALKSSES